MALFISVMAIMPLASFSQASRLILQLEREKAEAEAWTKNKVSSDTMLHFVFPPIEIQGEYIFKGQGKRTGSTINCTMTSSEPILCPGLYQVR